MNVSDNENWGNFQQQLRQKSSDELLQIALTASDEVHNSGWAAISALHARETVEVFEASKALCADHDPIKRSIGIALVAQLGLPPTTHREETLKIFLYLMDTEQDSYVLYSVAVGLGHLGSEPRKVKPLLKLKNHPDPQVRYGVVFGLYGEEDSLAIQALIELSSDKDDDIRDWATFGLGSMLNVDTSQIREALFARVIDPNDKSSAVGEGLVGLATRHDGRALELTLRQLQINTPGTLIFEAAEILADSRLCSALVQLRNMAEYGDYARSCLEAAIVACQCQP